jgi:hypothetical protein
MVQGFHILGVCEVVWLDERRILRVATSQEDFTHTLGVK